MSAALVANTTGPGGCSDQSNSEEIEGFDGIVEMLGLQLDKGLSQLLFLDFNL